MGGLWKYNLKSASSFGIYDAWRISGPTSPSMKGMRITSVASEIFCMVWRNGGKALTPVPLHQWRIHFPWMRSSWVNVESLVYTGATLVDFGELWVWSPGDSSCLSFAVCFCNTNLKPYLSMLSSHNTVVRDGIVRLPFSAFFGRVLMPLHL